VRRAVDRYRCIVDFQVGDLAPHSACAATAPSGSHGEVGPPVPLVAGWVEPVECGVPRRVRKFHHAVEGGLQSPDRRHQQVALIGRSGVAPHHAAHELHLQLGGERVHRRHGQESEEAVEVPRLAGRNSRYQRRISSVRSRGHNVGPANTVLTGCSRNVNCVTIPKLPPPPRSARTGPGCGRRLRSRSCRRPARRRPREVVDREPVLAGEVAQATTEGQATNTGGGDNAGRSRQAERVGRVVHVAELGPAPT